MVSKTILACLAALAAISMVQGTAVVSQDFSPCVRGGGFMIGGFGLDIDLGNLLGGILGVKVDIINQVLLTVGNILQSVLGLADNILAGLFGGIFAGGSAPAASSSVPSVPYPDTVEKWCLAQATYANICDQALEKKFPGVWQPGTLVNIWLNIANLLSVKLGIGADSLGSYSSLADTRKQISLINANIGVLQSDEYFGKVAPLISVYLNLLGDDGNLDADKMNLAGPASSLVNIELGVLGLGGYPNEDGSAFANAWAQSYGLLGLDLDLGDVLNLDLNLLNLNDGKYCGCY